MNQHHALMKFDPATCEEKPYPSNSYQYRQYHGKVAWLFNPWTGCARDAYDIGSDTFGHLIQPPEEPLLAAPLETVDARYRDLLNQLGSQSHDGATAEIALLRKTANLSA